MRPGQHGQKSGQRLSDYGKQLREKQKTRRIYGVLERQFRKTYAEAARSKGVTGERLLQLLETRLDNVAYRMGFGISRSEARQVVRHNGILVNGKRVNIPSYQVRPGDVIEVAGRRRRSCASRPPPRPPRIARLPEWVRGGRKGAEGQVQGAARAQPSCRRRMNESLIIELYSK